MKNRIEELKKEFGNLMLLKQEVEAGSGVHRAIMIEMGKIKLEIMDLSSEVYQQYRTK